MSGLRLLLVTTVVAAALGAVAGAVFVAFRGETALRVETPGRTGEPELAAGAGDEGERSGMRSEPPGSSADAASTRGLTQRLDDPDPAVRHALALELLRRGPEALSQARALRPATPAGRDLQGRLSAALRKLQLLRRSQDYGRLPEHIRLRLDLDAFASVVPEGLLVDERLAYWEREVRAVRFRLRKGVADPAEESLALLELAYAERAAGRIARDEYSQIAERLVPAIDEWVARRRADPGASPAELAELAEQVQRLR